MRPDLLAGLRLPLSKPFTLQVPVRHPTAVSGQHIKGSRRVEGEWAVLDKRYWPGDSVAEQLDFALRNEDLDLLVLKRLFEAIPQETVISPRMVSVEAGVRVSGRS